MILKQFYLNCLAHASYLVGDEQTQAAAVVDPQRDIEQYLDVRGRARPAHRARLPHPLSRGFPRRAPRAARSHRRHHLSRRSGPGRVSVHAAARRRRRRVRAGPAAGARNARAHRRVDLVDGVRPRSQRHRAAGRADGRHAVRRRRRPSGSARGARLVGQRPRRAALRLAARQAADAAGSTLRLSGARRRVAVRQGAQQGNVVDDRRAAAIELRAPADEQGGVRRARHGRSARRAVVLHLRRRAQHQGTSDARRDARARLSPLTLDQVLALQAVGAQILDTRDARRLPPRT